jgi:nicotinamide-nucleotide amidase
LQGYRASFPEIEVKVLARGGDREVVEARLRAAGSAVRTRIGERYVYGEGNVSLAAVVGELLAARGLKLGLAESCTGGLLSSLFTEVPGSSRYFLGSVCSYDNAVKCNLLGVGADTLGDHGAVSELVARQMATGAQRAFGADIGVGITGIAGPGGGTLEKPVGLVHWAVATPHTTVAKQHVFWGTRRQVQTRAAYASLATLRELLLERA